jgi:hypothetical protein
MADAMVRGDFRNEHTTRHEARKLKGNGQCESCSAAGVHIHHKDENPTNNAPGNLMRLCIKCHRQAHRKIVNCKYCGEPSVRIVQGYCLKHYTRFRKWGNPALVKRNQNAMLEIVDD